MAKTFTVNIITPEKTAFESEAVSVILPGTEGYLGVWANHAPLVTGVNPGVITIKESEGGLIRYMAVSGGFVEISGNTVNVMCESCERSGEIDLDRARSAVERAKERLHAGGEDVDKERAQAALERAQARLRAAYLKDGSGHH